MSIRISHSACQRYQGCGESYRLHYKERLRSRKIGSALFFGNALDDAFSRLLLDKKPDKTPEERDQLVFTPEQVFELKMLETQNDVGEIVAIPQSPLADYYTSDFDPALFSPEVIGKLQDFAPGLQTLEDIIAFHETCKEAISPRSKKRRRLPEDEFILYNYINWLSLFEKGKLLLQAYKTEVMPQIHTVYAIQKNISIINEHGDEITGKIDFIASFTDKPDVPVICDNKTSSKPYSDDSVRTSEQLATYCEAEQNFNAAYVVVEKKIRAKAPKVRVSVIKDTVPEKMLQITFDNYEKVVHNVSAEKFERNWDNCFAFGKVCPFYRLCKHNSSEGLVKKDEK